MLGVPLRRDLIITAILVTPTALHDFFHAIDGLSNWRASELLPWIAWAFTSHEGLGFYTHIAIVLSTIATLLFIGWRMVHYALRLKDMVWTLAVLYDRMLYRRQKVPDIINEIEDF